MAHALEMIPAPEVTEYHGEVPTAFADLTAFSPLGEIRQDPVHSVPAAVAPVAWAPPAGNASGLELPELERFRALMADAHWPVHVPRMLADRRYACDRIVLAQASPSPQLRALALSLFKVLQARSHSH
jgi:hypothetical protein